MNKRGRFLIIAGIVLILLTLVFSVFVLSAGSDFSTICYNEKHSIINHKDTTSDEQKSINAGSGITGAIIGAGQQFLSGWQLVAIIAIIGGVLIVFIISKTILRLKEGVIKKK